jgi:transcriptional regulator GlxA family with amidase domain
MKRVTILGLTDTSASIVAGPFDLFIYAGTLWNQIFGEPKETLFEVETVSLSGSPFSCDGGLEINAQRDIASVHETDLLLIPSIFNIKETLTREGAVVPWIKKMQERGAHVAGICTGVFVLAETGLLDGKVATTHWGAAESFRRRYPKVTLKPELLITDYGDIFTAGGSNACFDIGLYLVRKYCGLDVARKLAKTFLHDLDRVSQAPWTAFQCQRGHRDKEIRKAQERLETRYSEQYSFDEFARELGMSRRSFERRFKAATGDSPLQYLQRMRVEAAKRMLETENLNFYEIAYAVGYEDRGFFSKVFTQVSGLTPKAYRQKWSLPTFFLRDPNPSRGEENEYNRPSSGP